MGHRDVSGEIIYYGITVHGYIYAVLASSAYPAINILGITNSDTEYGKSGMENFYLLKNTELSPSGFIIPPTSRADLQVISAYLNLVYFSTSVYLSF